MKRSRSLRRLQSRTLVGCLLFFGIVGNWHVHGLEAHGSGELSLAAPVQDHPVGVGCPACSLGHPCSSELRSAISPVTEQVVGHSTSLGSTIHDTPWPNADPTRAPPARL